MHKLDIGIKEIGFAEVVRSGYQEKTTEELRDSLEFEAYNSLEASTCGGNCGNCGGACGGSCRSAEISKYMQKELNS